MLKSAYDTDLTNDQWEILQPLIPEVKIGSRPRTLDLITSALEHLKRTSDQLGFTVIPKRWMVEKTYA